jgi:hypothetical protein
MLRIAGFFLSNATLRIAKKDMSVLTFAFDASLYVLKRKHQSGVKSFVGALLWF